MDTAMLQRMEHAIVALARQAIFYYLTFGDFLQPAADFPWAQQEPAGVFVPLKCQSQLRGCIGTCLPTQPSLLQEIIRNAISAATGDPRFPPITVEEMEEMDVSVDVLTSPESVEDIDQLDPKRYGVIIRAGRRVGVLLPDIPQVTTVELQMAVARRKAGIGPDEPVGISRFEVTRYH
jgi:AmmeMemoRadiSam system protein A